MIAIVDYGLGNLSSVAGAIERLGHEARITSSMADLEAADRLVLPGVGAFGDGMDRLRRLGLADALTRLVLDGKKPILGICLGAQLMARVSHEFGLHEGLGWIDAEVVRIEPRDGLRVPHVGWNDLVQVRPSPLLDDVPGDALFYFVHSFHVRCASEDVVIGRTDYGGPITAAFQRDHLFATQFHPEKSQRHGLTVLRNFVGPA